MKSINALDIYDAVLGRHTKIVRMNLSADSYEIIKASEPVPESATYKLSVWFSCFIESDLLHPDDKDIFEHFSNIHNLQSALSISSEQYLSIHYRRRDGDRYRWSVMDLVKLPSWSVGNQEVMAFVRDVHNDYGHEYEYLESLEQMNAYDSSTGLKNRISYNRTIRQLETTPEQVGVVYCDLNGLKIINDTQGHAAGDRYISSFARILTDYFRPLECYKIGGDEFVVITCGMAENLFIKRTKAFTDAINSERIPIASIGAAFGSNIKICIDEAEKNMYNNKAEFYKKHPDYKR